MTADKLGPTESLECCCCGGGTRGRQWHNRDTGYGMCVSCIAYVKKRGMPDEEILENYGHKGVHYDVEVAERVKSALIFHFAGNWK